MAAGVTEEPPRGGAHAATRPSQAAASVVLGLAGTALLLAVVLRVFFGGPEYLVTPLTIALALSAAAAFVAWWWGGMPRSLLAVAFVTAAVALYSAEALLEFARRDPAAVVARRLGRAYDARARWQLVDSLRRLGVDAWPSMAPAVAWRGDKILGVEVPWPDSLPPLAGVPGVVTVYCNESAQYSIYRSDARGYNNTGAGDTAGPGGIALLGDSYLHGACVPAESGLVALLRTRRPDARNFAQDGLGPLLELATLREVVAPLRPRLVVWTWFEGNDLANLRLERADPRLMAYLDPSHGLGRPARDARVLRRWTDSVLSVARSARPPGLPARVAGLVALPRLRKMWRDRRPPESPPDEDLELLGRVLRTARADAEGWGARLVLAYLPGWYRYHAPQRYRPRRDDVLAAARNAGVPVLDLEPALARAPDHAALFSSGRWLPRHYSVAGYQVAAEALHRALDSLESAGYGARP